MYKEKLVENNYVTLFRKRGIEVNNKKTCFRYFLKRIRQVYFMSIIVAW